MHSRSALLAGTLLMFLAVAAGAFGAHALRTRLDPAMLGVWQTGAQYQALHALALVGLGLYLRQHASACARWAAALFALGCVLFSGSLYALALTGVRGVGAVTPFGGAAFLAGWVCWFVAVWREPRG